MANTNRAMNARLMKYAASTRPTVMKNGGEQPALGLRLPGDAGNQGVTGDAVTDTGADGAAAQNEAAADQAPITICGSAIPYPPWLLVGAYQVSGWFGVEHVY